MSERRLTQTQVDILRQIADESVEQNGHVRQRAGAQLAPRGLVDYDGTAGELGRWAITERGRAALEPQG